MKRLFLMVVMLFSVYTLKAQYYGGHPITNQAAQMVQQMQMMNAMLSMSNQWPPPAPGVVPTPSWDQIQSQPQMESVPQVYTYETVSEKCSNCDGEGFITTNHYSRDGGYTSKRRCSFCHGTGRVEKRVIKED